MQMTEVTDTYFSQRGLNPWLPEEEGSSHRHSYSSHPARLTWIWTPETDYQEDSHVNIITLQILLMYK